MSEQITEEEAVAHLTAMIAAIKDHPFDVLKMCKHDHMDGGTGIGSVSFFVAHKDDDSECWGCFAEHMDDGFHMALERIWALLAPIGAENLDKLRSSSAKEVSIPEMLARARMAWELAEEMLFSGDASAFIKVLIQDEKEAARRTTMLDGPIRKLLENTGKRLKMSQDFTGKLGAIERYRAIRKEIDKALNRQAAEADKLAKE